MRASYESPDLHGSCFGVDFTPRNIKDEDKAVIIELSIEDDLLWHRYDFKFSAFWLNDLILTLQKARHMLQGPGFVPDIRDGFKFQIL